MLETVLPLSFVPVTIFPHVNAIAGSFRLAPLSNVGVPIDALPDALAFLESAAPFTLVNLAIRPCVNAFAMRFPAEKLAFVSVTV